MKDVTIICLAERKPEVWGKWPRQKYRARKKTGITRPCPDGGVIMTKNIVAFICIVKDFVKSLKSRISSTDEKIRATF